VFWSASRVGRFLVEDMGAMKLYDRYHDQGAEFLGVSLDPPEEYGGLEELKEFVAEKHVPWPQYFQGHDDNGIWTGTPTDDFSEHWGISHVPVVFLIDREGKLYSTEARDRLATMLPRLLKRP